MKNKTCQCECENYHKSEKDYSLNLSTCNCENSNYFKSVAYASVTKCDKTVSNCCEKIINKKDKHYDNQCYNYYFNKLS